MLAEISHQKSQAYLKQRNMLAMLCLALIGLMLVVVMLFSAKDREVILQPILSRPMTVSSAGPTADYLELVTRDTASVMLNRSPVALEYWMEQVLRVVDPAYQGRVKAELLRIVTEQKDSDVSQAFSMTGMKVDPRALASEVTGVVTVFVGKKVIASDKRTFRFRWSYQGLSLAMIEFGEVLPKGAKEL